MKARPANFLQSVLRDPVKAYAVAITCLLILMFLSSSSMLKPKPQLVATFNQHTNLPAECLPLTKLESVYASASQKCEVPLADSASEFWTNMTFYPTVELFGHKMAMFDRKGGKEHFDYIVSEFRDDVYKLQKLNLVPGDVIVDIGGNIGFFSIVAAKLFPGVHIYTFEPMAGTYWRHAYNLCLNAADGVTLFHGAVTQDSRDITIHLIHPHNPSSATTLIAGGKDKLNSYYKETVPSITLEDIYQCVTKRHGTNKVALLKMDCEGCEYELLTDSILQRSRYFRTEFHSNLVSKQVHDRVYQIVANNVRDFGDVFAHIT